MSKRKTLSSLQAELAQALAGKKAAENLLIQVAEEVSGQHHDSVRMKAGEIDVGSRCIWKTIGRLRHLSSLDALTKTTRLYL